MRESNERGPLMDPVQLAHIVIPISFFNGQTYDATTILQMYKRAHGSLAGNGFINCSLTRGRLYVEPAALRPNLKMPTSVSENENDYAELPNDIEIIAFIFEKYSWEYCRKYIPSTEKKKILGMQDENKVTALMHAARYQPDAVAPILNAISTLDDKAEQATLLGMKNKYGATALIVAVRYQLGAVGPILNAIIALDDEDQHAILGAKANDDATALMLAVSYQPDAVAAILKVISALRDKVKQFELLGMKDKRNRTALVLAVQHKLDAVEPILKAIAALEDKVKSAEFLGIQAEGGMTALMEAVMHQQKAVEPILKAIVALPDKAKQAKILAMENNGGNTALMLEELYVPYPGYQINKILNKLSQSLLDKRKRTGGDENEVGDPGSADASRSSQSLPSRGGGPQAKRQKVGGAHSVSALERRSGLLEKRNGDPCSAGVSGSRSSLLAKIKRTGCDGNAGKGKRPGESVSSAAAGLVISQSLPSRGKRTDKDENKVGDPCSAGASGSSSSLLAKRNGT